MNAVHAAHLLKNIRTLPTMLSTEDFARQTARVSEQAKQALALERQAAAQRIVDRLLMRSAIPSRYRAASLERGAVNQADAYALVRGYRAQFFEHLHTGCGLLIVGDIGVGKTHLACALANALMAEHRPVLYCTALEAVLLVKQSWSQADQSELGVYRQFAQPELLIIDEIGVQHGSEFERMVLTAIIDARSRALLPTVAISNLDVGGVFDALGERSFDRLQGGGGHVIEMRGPSLRVRAMPA